MRLRIVSGGDFWFRVLLKKPHPGLKFIEAILGIENDILNRPPWVTVVFLLDQPFLRDCGCFHSTYGSPLHCADSDEVSIYSEFDFSGSLISDNLIERGAAGISITNFDHGGRLCVCSGNIVRDMKAGSPTNPDVVPYGIAAEADAVVTGNVVDGVPGTGILVGWGPYLRDVIVSENLVRDCEVGISVSVVPEAGHARVSGNLVSGSHRHAIVGARWRELVATDLAASAAVYGNVTVTDNRIV